VFLARIRYYIYFQLSGDEQSVEVVAFWHGNRGSSPDLALPPVAVTCSSVLGE
jgi:hypothetical protein